MMYYANFNVNNGTRLIHPEQGTNKYKLMREIINRAKSELFPGNDGRWCVWDENDNTIVEGYIDQNGRNHAYKG